jgi:YHS domain-containing protein
MKFPVSLASVAVALAALIASPFVIAADEAEASDIDHLLVAAQGICPVSGEQLGDHGNPIKTTTTDGRTIFLCCEGCKGQEFSKEHWSKMLGNMADAQGVCPVMKKDLPQQPASIVVEGRTVFVCCKPCTSKIKADPEKYLSVVDEKLEKNVGHK